MTPIGEENSSVRHNGQTSCRSRRREQIDRTEAETDNVDNNTDQGIEQDADTALSDEETRQVQNNLRSKLASEIMMHFSRQLLTTYRMGSYLQTKTRHRGCWFRQTTSSSKMTNCGIWRV
jgi:hypothetical protein